MQKKSQGPSAESEAPNWPFSIGSNFGIYAYFTLLNLTFPHLASGTIPTPNIRGEFVALDLALGPSPAKRSVRDEICRN